MNSKLLIKSGLAAVLITLLYILFDLIFGSVFNLTHYGWQTLSNLLIVVILGYFIAHSNLTRINLALTTFIIYYGIGHFNILIEALIFNVTDRTETINGMLQGLLIALIISPILVYLLDKWNSQQEIIKFKSRSVFSWIWRVILGDLLYFIFYAIAGFTLQAVYPEFMEFYKDKIPPFNLIIYTQFIRGFIFIGIAVLILRTLNLSLTKKAILIGLVFSILGGIAPLIPPNEYMPGYVRLGHGFEVGISNFLYGLVLGYLLGQKSKNEIITAANIV